MELVQLTRAERDDIRDALSERYGWERWAELRGFPVESVRNILYREMGLKPKKTEASRDIVKALKREFLK